MNCLVSDKDLTTNHAIVMKVYYKITELAIKYMI